MFKRIILSLALLAPVTAHAQASWMTVQQCRANAIMTAPTPQAITKESNACYKLAGKNAAKWKREDSHNFGSESIQQQDPVDAFRGLRRGFEPADRYPNMRYGLFGGKTGPY